jgi:hypothetical protein
VLTALLCVFGIIFVVVAFALILVCSGAVPSLQ